MRTYSFLRAEKVRLQMVKRFPMPPSKKLKRQKPPTITSEVLVSFTEQLNISFSLLSLIFWKRFPQYVSAYRNYLLFALLTFLRRIDPITHQNLFINVHIGTQIVLWYSPFIRNSRSSQNRAKSKVQVT